MVRVSRLANVTKGLGLQHVEPRRITTDLGDRIGFISTQEASSSQQGSASVVFSISEEQAVSSIDAEKHELVGELVTGCSELVALTLWLLAESLKGTDSKHADLISSLPEKTDTPLLWPDDELEFLLAGSTILNETKNRVKELKRQWQMLHDEYFSKDPMKFSPEVFGYSKFAAAFSVVLAHAIYLPSAQLFVVAPIVSLLGRTGNGNGCFVDYDSSTQQVVITGDRTLREGQEILLNDARPNGELLMATGTLPSEANSSDFLEFPASLIQADRYYEMKSQILESVGFAPKERFPVYADRMPNQLLAYVRLARVQDPALFAKVSFEQDVILSQMNEYEVLQLLMGDCRERLALYRKSLEEDIKINQGMDLSRREKLAVKLRLSEKRIISATMDAVRQRLAPIRGIVTKSGMQDVNQDLKEIFDTLESIPLAPQKIFQGLMDWASGKDDPDWGKKPSNKKLPPRPW